MFDASVVLPDDDHKWASFCCCSAVAKIEDDKLRGQVHVGNMEVHCIAYMIFDGALGSYLTLLAGGERQEALIKLRKVPLTRDQRLDTGYDSRV